MKNWGNGGFYSWTEMSMGVGGGNTNENRKEGREGGYRERRQKDIAQGRNNGGSGTKVGSNRSMDK